EQQILDELGGLGLQHVHLPVRSDDFFSHEKSNRVLEYWNFMHDAQLQSEKGSAGILPKCLPENIGRRGDLTPAGCRLMRPGRSRSPVALCASRINFPRTSRSRRVSFMAYWRNRG